MDRDETLDLEREYKFLLDAAQYQALWSRLRDGASVRLQDNFFFDRDDRLRRTRWMLRLRLERGPNLAQEREAPATPPSFDGLGWGVVRALVTLKGPAVATAEGVVRPEVEEALPTDAAAAAAASGRLDAASLPARVREALSDKLGGVDFPGAFFNFAGIRNLRLLRSMPTATGAIEVALDQARTTDGRIRYELEIEYHESDGPEVQTLLTELDTVSLQPTSHGKLYWALGLEGG